MKQHHRNARSCLAGLAAAAILLSVATTLACSSSASVRAPFPVTPSPDQPSRSPVVFVPGVTGNSLRNERTDRLLWGSTRALFFPRDGGRSLVLPLDGGEDFVRAEGPLLHMRVLFWHREVYRPLAHLMATAGYRQGNLEEPKAGDGFFFFVYDWRHDTLSAVRRLATQLEGLRRARREERLVVTLMCQSNAARICRYYAKYGVSTPAEIAAGTALPPSITVDKLILVGTSNGGALRILHELNRGRVYVPILGRTWLPESLFTLRSLYEDLPTYTEDLFFDESGRRLDVDLFDVANWERYGWSVFADAVRKRLQRPSRSQLFADEATRRSFIASQLERAATLNRLLQNDPSTPLRTRYYLLAAQAFETPARALLRRGEKGWETHFADDRAVRREPELYALAVEAGDGHATAASQTCLSPGERQALVENPLSLGGGHFEVLLEPAAEEKILQYLSQ